MTSACHGPNCQGEFKPASWLDPWFCSYDCRSAWCLANGRNQAGEPLPGVSAPTVATTPIIHPAGVIPPDVVQAVTEQIEAKRTGTLIAAVWGASGTVPPGPWRTPTQPTDSLEAQSVSPTQLGRPGFWARAIRAVFG